MILLFISAQNITMPFCTNSISTRQKGNKKIIISTFCYKNVHQSIIGESGIQSSLYLKPTSWSQPAFLEPNLAGLIFWKAMHLFNCGYIWYEIKLCFCKSKTSFPMLTIIIIKDGNQADNSFPMFLFSFWFSFSSVLLPLLFVLLVTPW